MAREYELLYKLNAQLNSGFNSAFKSAQSEMSRFREGYRNLSTTANDISGYQRQQTAVENTKGKLELLQTQYDNIKREMDETGGFSSDLANKLAAKQAQIDKTTKAYQEQIDKLNDYKRRLEEAGVDTTDLDKELQRLREELKRTKEGFKGTGDGAEEFGEKSKDAVSEFADVLAGAGIVAGLKKVYDAFAACVTIAADFEAAMSNVEAISGATGDEMTALTNRAKDLGATTAFTAQQVSEGMSYMAMAGWKTNDMLDGMDAVLALAAASGEDLATTSDIVTDALTAFGLTAKDTARFADVLAAASSNANTNVGMMGETFKYAAPVAGALGYSIEDVAVATGLMANSGIKASQAGTTLRNIFNGLLNGVELTGEAFGEVNLSFENTDGTMKDLSTSINILRGYFNQMTEAERVHNAINLAGQRGYSGLLAILNSTTEDYDKLTDAINNSSGAAQKMADIKLDNLNGQATIAKSAFEGMEVEIGNALLPILTEVYQSFGKIFGDIAEFVKNNPETVRAIAALVTGFAAFVAIVMVAKVAMIAFNAICNSNVILLAAAAIISLITALALFSASEKAATEETEELSVASQAQADHIAELNEQYAEVCATIGETSTEAQLLKREIESCTEEFDNSKKTFSEVQEELEDLYETFEKSQSAYLDSKKALETEQEGTLNLISSLKELTSAENQTAESKEKIAAIVALLNERIPELGLNYNKLTGMLNMSPEEIIVAARVQYTTTTQENAYSKLQEALAQEQTLKEAADTAQAEYDAAQKKRAEAQGAYYADKFMSGVFADSSAYDEAVEAEERARINLQNAKDAYDENEYTIQSLAETVSDYVKQTDEASTSTASARDVVRDINAALTELGKAYDEAYKAALESIQGQYKLWDKVPEVAAVGVDTINANLEGQTTYWTNYKTNMETLLAYADKLPGLAEVVASFNDGSAESVNTIAGMAQSLASGDTTALATTVKNWQEMTAAQKGAADAMAQLAVDYPNKLNEIIESTTESVDTLDCSDRSYLAAINTMQSYIDGAADMSGPVADAFAKVGNIAIAAFNAAIQANSDSWKNDNDWGTPFTPYGYVPQSGTDVSTNATGTGNASAGYSIVGENGPELVLFRGGEQVLNTTRTAQLLGNRGYTVSFAPVYQISGSVNSDELMDVLTAHDEALKEQLLDLLDEAQTDRVRRRYS